MKGKVTVLTMALVITGLWILFCPGFSFSGDEELEILRDIRRRQMFEEADREMDRINRLPKRKSKTQEWAEALEEFNGLMGDMRRDRQRKLFYEWKDKSPQGIMRFGKENNIPLDELSEYMKFAR